MMRPRFTLRWVMAAVAIVAVALLGVRLMIRRGHHLQMAAMYQKREAEARQREAWSMAMARKGYVSPKAAASDRARTEHMGRMRSKYVAAAAHPWLPVEPDASQP